MVKTGKRVACTFAMAVALAGCATAAQRQAQSIGVGFRSAVQQVQACVVTVYNSDEFASLRQHMPYNYNQATLEQLSDQNYVTDDDIRTILAVHPKLQACRQQALDGISKVLPTVMPIIVSRLATGEDNLIALIQKKETWGDYVRRGRDNAIAATTEFVAEARRIEAGLEQAHEAEVAQRQAAIQAAAATYAQTQQTIAAMRNSTLNCTSIEHPRPVGTAPSFTYTTCR